MLPQLKVAASGRKGGVLVLLVCFLGFFFPFFLFLGGFDSCSFIPDLGRGNARNGTPGAADTASPTAGELLRETPAKSEDFGQGGVYFQTEFLTVCHLAAFGRRFSPVRPLCLHIFERPLCGVFLAVFIKRCFFFYI